MATTTTADELSTTMPTDAHIDAPNPPQSTFTAIPTLSLSQARSPDTKLQFLSQLRDALLTTGFLYIRDTSIPTSLTTSVITHTRSFFESLPSDRKHAIEMHHKPSFLGYSRPLAEMTAGAPDHREQLDLATPHAHPSESNAEAAPVWQNLWGPNQWPEEEGVDEMVGFRQCMEEYMWAMSELSEFFTTLIAEALGMESDAFARFFDEDQAHKMKLIKYPEAPLTVEGSEIDRARQGVGPHKDSMLSSFLLQASEHRGLQVQNNMGQWVDVPPKDGTLVVALGQGLEAITAGVCASTTHRVLSPEAGSGSRYSVPFFQGVSFDADFESMNVPEEVRELKRKAVDEAGGRKDDVEFTFVKGKWRNLGEATLMNRVKSHPDVSERWVCEKFLLCQRFVLAFFTVMRES